MMNASPELLSEHAAYLSDTHLLALLELGLEAMMRDQKDDKKTPLLSPLCFLATWLARHNPKHSKEGKALLEQFANELGTRAPLGDLEERERIEAAKKLQAASRGHASRLMAGEQKAAAVKMQAASRGRAARRAQDAEAKAATTVQASVRGNSARKGLAAASSSEEQPESGGRQAHSAPPGGRSGEGGGDDGARRASIQLVPGADGTVRAVATEEDGVEEQDEDAARAAAATKMQALQRGRSARR